jgi:hypothetical protein
LTTKKFNDLGREDFNQKLVTLSVEKYKHQNRQQADDKVAHVLGSHAESIGSAAEGAGGQQGKVLQPAVCVSVPCLYIIAPLARIKLGLGSPHSELAALEKTQERKRATLSELQQVGNDLIRCALPAFRRSNISAGTRIQPRACWASCAWEGVSNASPY